MTVDRKTEVPLADRIMRVRERLEAIGAERATLPPEDFARKAELLDEEHTLEARLAELRAEAAEAGVGLAEGEAGNASNYERVPEVPPDNSIEDVS